MLYYKVQVFWNLCLNYDIVDSKNHCGNIEIYATKLSICKSALYLQEIMVSKFAVIIAMKGILITLPPIGCRTWI